MMCWILASLFLLFLGGIFWMAFSLRDTDEEENLQPWHQLHYPPLGPSPNQEPPPPPSKTFSRKGDKK